jgi:hypothetical protein
MHIRIDKFKTFLILELYDGNSTDQNHKFNFFLQYQIFAFLNEVFITFQSFNHNFITFKRACLYIIIMITMFTTPVKTAVI